MFEASSYEQRPLAHYIMFLGESTDLHEEKVYLDKVPTHFAQELWALATADHPYKGDKVQVLFDNGFYTMKFTKKGDTTEILTHDFTPDW